MQGSKLERTIEAKLGDLDLRFTRGRRRVVAALAQADGPRSASELDRSLGGGIPLSSLYRSLAVLEESGIVSPHHGTRGVTRYELAEWLSGHHHHLVCVECGGVEDIRLDEDVEKELEALVERVSRDSSFDASGHSLEIDGTCGQCR